MASVVLVHGIRTSSAMWREQSRRLSDAGVEHLAVDLPGHGSRAGEPVTLPRCRQVIDEAVDALGQGCVVVGLSLGSYVTIDWAARTRTPPTALVLASCGTRPQGIGLRGYIAAASLIGLLPDRGLGLHTVLARRVLGDVVARDLLDGGVPLEAMVPALRAVQGVEMLADLQRIGAPIWFVNGRWDHFRTEERRILRAAPRATLVTIPRASHLVALDRPDEFAATLLDVVAQVDAWTAARQRSPVPFPQRPHPHAADDAGGVGHDHDVVPELGDDRRHETA
jgi:pimeloyl-ACP methyl ester carboxylesterase